MTLETDMVKGWRNDPSWVKYKEDKKEAALKKRMDRFTFQQIHAVYMQKAEIERDQQRLMIDLEA